MLAQMYAIHLTSFVFVFRQTWLFHYLFGKYNSLLLCFKQKQIMGKGDKKTKRGKIHIGSSGVSRPKKKVTATAAKAEKTEVKKAE